MSTRRWLSDAADGDLRHGGAAAAFAAEHAHDHSHADHAHDHSHAHHADQAHSHADHSHSHDHAAFDAHTGAAVLRRLDRAPEREWLAEGAGAGAVLFVDPQSGIAGDMCIGALVDLGVPPSVPQAAVAQLPLPDVQLVLSAAMVGALGATKADVRWPSGQPERTFAAIRRLLTEASLAAPVRALALRIFERLAAAEAEVHRISLEAVAFHEVGAVDAIVDVVGTAAALVYLGVTDVVSAPVPLGRGHVHARHGVLPLPAPATLLCLRGVPTVPSGLDVELVTPTGAAILGAIATRFEAWPALVPRAVGYGAGTRSLPDRPNLLRLVLGDRPVSGEELWLLEVNVDDLTGELAAHTLARLLEHGALDAWATPIVMKKGRPALTLSALVAPGRRAEVETALLTETTSIGVRRRSVTRTERPRELRVAQTAYGDVPVKVSGGPFGAPTVKPEFDVCVALAARANVPVRLVLEAALAAATPAHEGG